MAARFDAFISYSRSASSRLAVELRNGIERFAKPWYRLRSSRVFLDDASMSANTGLWSNIERGLTEADWFILLCSPKSAASEYVTNEIRWWLEHKSADRILMVLDEGEILWKGGDFDWDRATAVNPALSGAFAEEPRWVDLSWFEQDGSLGAADPRFPERVADLAAAIRGLERDELIGANVRERRRALRLLRGGVIALSALLVASLVATVLAVVNGNAAAEQARIALARQIAAQAITLAATDLQAASLLAVEAQRLHDDPYTRAALFQLATSSPQLVRSLPVGAPVTGTEIDDLGRVYTVDQDGGLVRWDGDEREDLADLGVRLTSVSVSGSGDHVAAVAADGVVRVVTPTGDTELTVTPPVDPVDGTPLAPPTLAELSDDGAYLAVTDRSLWVTVFVRQSDDGETLYTPVGTAPFGGRIGFGDGELTVFSASGVWARVSLIDAAVLDDGWHSIGANATGVAVSRDGSALTASIGKSVNYAVWDAVGSVSGGGDVDGDPPDRIATSTVAGFLDLALDTDGDRLAVLSDGAIYVSEVREPGALADAPVALLGAGDVEPESLSFRGDLLVNGTDEYALVWDLTQDGRIAEQFEAPVPEGCTACGPQSLAISPDGERAVLWAIPSGSAVLVGLDDGSATDIDPDAQFGLGSAAWIDDERFAVTSIAERVVFVVAADDLAVEDAVPLPLGDGVAALAVRPDGDGGFVAIGDDGTLLHVDASGAVVAESAPFRELLDSRFPLSYGIAPDASTAYVFSTDADLDDDLRQAVVATGTVVFTADAPEGAAYDGDSRLHVFGDRRDSIRDAAGAETGNRRADVEQIPPPVLSPDGRLVASGGSEGRIELIDLARGGAVFGSIAVPVQENKFAVSGFSTDGRSMVVTVQAIDSLGRPATVTRLTLDPGDWRTAACAVAGRDLTAEEWRDAVGSEPPADLRCER